MSQPALLSAGASSTLHPPAADTRLRGRWLVLARVGTMGLALASWALFFVMFPAIISFLETPCPDGSCPLTPEQAHTLSALGLTLGNYAAYSTALSFISIAPGLIVAGILFWRRSDDWMALLVALGAADPSGGIVGATGIWQTPAFLLHSFNLMGFYLIFSLFPTGRLVPRWTYWFVIGWMIFNIIPLFISLDTLPNWLVGPLYLVFYGNLLFSQIYRYRRVSGPVERQQTKWVVFGLLVVLLANVAYWQPYAFIPALRAPDSLYAPLVYPIFIFITGAIPLSIGVAILRYRLWDIDTLINKALVYGLLTALLGALYAGLIIGLESLVDASQPVVIVLSTLAIALLFLPARRRIQAIIDRQFYRRKYDAEKTLAAFSATLRQEVDLEQIRAQLIGVVTETMQPAHVSLWLRQPSPSAEQSPPPLEPRD